MELNPINTHNYNILLAEDNEANQALLERMLSNGGHSVTIVSNGQQALDELCLSQYDLCLIDIQMPVLDGLQTIAQFKKTFPENRLPFIILTADESPGMIKKCQQAGALYLTKPIRTEALLQAIDNIFSAKKDKQPAADRKVIDISKLDYFKDQAFLDKFIELFEESCDKLSINLRDSCVGDYDGFKRAVHTIKGLSGNINAEALREICIEAESLSQEKYKHEADEYNVRITDELSRARDELNRLSSKMIEG